jgi:hypothetical protein
MSGAIQIGIKIRMEYVYYRCGKIGDRMRFDSWEIASFMRNRSRSAPFGSEN